MNETAGHVGPVPGALLAADSPMLTKKTAFPIAVSENKRYFVDRNGDPVFWLGTTQWQLFRGCILDQARTILERTAANGFKFTQVMALGTGDGTLPNVHGQKPCIDDDPLTPNEEYFKNVDAVLDIAGETNLAISMTLFHHRYRELIPLEKARAWARWLAERYKDVPHIVWSMTPWATEEFVPILRELAAGLREGDEGRHLVTLKPDPSPDSSSFIHGEDWLDFNSMQTHKYIERIRPMVTYDYNLKPTKPVLMAEGAYEAGIEYGFDVPPLLVRRQAYYSFLCGAYHTYGHNDSWRVEPTWEQALDSPGAVQMGILKRIFMARPEWWLMVPDLSVLVPGKPIIGDMLRLAARHQDGKWAMIYLGGKADISVNMDKVAGPVVNAFWIKPETGDSVAAGTFPNSGQQSFTTPEGWEDALLILESADSP